MDSIERIYFATIEEWRAWLKENHQKAKHIAVIRYKKHTGKPSPSHMELMHEAICWGWIDTTVKRIDEDTYIVNFRPRNKNSKWSTNTLSYAKKLIKDGRMSPIGLLFYKEGLRKGAYNADREENPKMPVDLERELGKDKSAMSNFERFAPSYRKMVLRWLLSAKMPETRKKRISALVKSAKENRKLFS